MRAAAAAIVLAIVAGWSAGFAPARAAVILGDGELDAVSAGTASALGRAAATALGRGPTLAVTSTKALAPSSGGSSFAISSAEAVAAADLFAAAEIFALAAATGDGTSATALVWAGSAASGGTAAAAGCPQVQFVFARGTSEPAGIGRVGAALSSQLATQLGGRSYGVYAVDYPATYDFLAAADGAADATNHIAEMAQNCPSTRFVLGGYSQGAAVIDMLMGTRSGSLCSRAATTRSRDVMVFFLLIAFPPRHGVSLHNPALKHQSGSDAV